MVCKGLVGGEHDPGSAWYSDKNRQYVVCRSGLVEKGRGMPEPWALWAHDTEAHLLVLYLPQAFQYQCGPGHARKQDSQSGIPMEDAKLKKAPQK